MRGQNFFPDESLGTIGSLAPIGHVGYRNTVKGRGWSEKKPKSLTRESATRRTGGSHNANE